MFINKDQIILTTMTAASSHWPDIRPSLRGSKEDAECGNKKGVHDMHPLIGITSSLTYQLSRCRLFGHALDAFMLMILNLRLVLEHLAVQFIDQ